jgi:F0F1-type ATP synthase membrane subunit c/vacuolar-type H+-ATPase subunit K
VPPVPGRSWKADSRAMIILLAIPETIVILGFVVAALVLFA